MESVLWASEYFNRSATSANEGWLSPHEVFYGSRPPLSLLPFFKPAYHRVPNTRKTEPRARLCYFLNFGYNHGRDCYKLLDAETGKVIYSRDVTWHHPQAPLIPPVNADRSPPTALQEEIYVHVPIVPAPTPAPTPTSAPAPTSAPVPTPAPEPWSASPTRPPQPPPSSKPVAPIPPRVSGELHHEGYE